MSDAIARHPDEERFNEFFHDPTYIALKNYLYNYQCRRRAIHGVLAQRESGLLLEVGSGLSPIVTDTDDIIYSELSHAGLRNLRAQHGRGLYVVADGTRLPFRDGSIPRIVCSEVLEHVEDDARAIAEIGRVLAPKGTAIITVPHGPHYFASDDRFVSHFRRYTVADMEAKLAAAGLRSRRTLKVLGPFEKIVMWSCVAAFRILERLGLVGGTRQRSDRAPGWVRALLPLWRAANAIATPVARADAAIMPRAAATVMLFDVGRAE
jgi:SAM-dependent methyltransferase